MREGTLSRRDFLRLVGAGATTLAISETVGPAIAAAADRKPNVLLILADDLGYGELSIQGNKEIPTPNIDSIGKRGVRFTSGYVSCPVCSPTRAGLMTGRYQQRFGHEFNPGSVPAASFGLPQSETTLASRMKSAGYATGLVGKWHLGTTEGYRPLERGFDEFFGFLGGAHSYIESLGTILRGNQPVDEKEYLTDALGREAKAFIDKHASEPFFLYLAFNAVHAPLQVPEKYRNRFTSIQDEKRRTFAGMLSAMDDAVGGVLETLRKHDLEENTLIFFLSDNGGPTPSTTSRNDPLRGTKGQVHEGGIRVPFMVQWKGQLPAGTVSDTPVIALDIAPTALAAAGATAENARFDGVNLIPAGSKRLTAKPHDVLFWRFGQQWAVREDNWKLLDPGSGQVELYDLAADIGEKTNLASSNADKVKQLRLKYDKWNSELVKPLWSGRQGWPAARRRQRRQQ